MNIKNVHFRIVFILLAFVLLTPNFIWAVDKKEITFVSDNDEENDISLLYGKRIGIAAGTITHETILELFPKFKRTDFHEYPSIMDAVMALEHKKVDAVVYDLPFFELLEKQNDKVKIFKRNLSDDYFGFAFRKNNNSLYPKFANVIKNLIESGKMQEIKDIWIGNDESKKVLPVQNWPNPNGTFIYATDLDSAPMGYWGPNNKPIGFELNIIYEAAKELGMHVQVSITNSDGRVLSLLSGKADIGGGMISITPERAQQMNFVKYYKSSPSILVRNPDYNNSKNPTEENFLDDLCSSFTKTFITENRWLLILEGLLTTVVISITSGILGLILGFLVCMLRLSKNSKFSKIAKLYITIIQGIPTVVLLMMIYYIVFMKVDVNAIVASVIGFAINFSAYVSEMIRTGIESIDKGQKEAGMALGYNAIQTFLKIILPQAAKQFIPVVKGEFIGLIKTTSVIGYIAGFELTKATDIIRARTMDAFFPLIVVSIIYFILSNFFANCISKIEVRIDPKHRERAISL